VAGGRQTKAQLLAELKLLRERVAALEAEAVAHQSAEKKPTDSELRYRAVVECSIQGIAVQRHGTVLFANAALATILGYAEPHDLIGQQVENLIAVEERERLRGYLAARLRGEPAPARYECRGIRKDGTPIWLEVAPAIVSWSGEPAVIISLIDITTRKRAEHALRQSELLYRTVLKNIHDGVFLVQDAHVLFVNEAGARLVEAQRETLLGRPFLSLVAPESIDRVRDGFRYCEEFGQGPTLDDVPLFSPAGDRRVIVQAQMVIVSYDERKALLVTLRDITAHKRAEETIKEEAEVSAALARVGRELMTSLETPVVLDRLCRLTTEVLGCDCSYAALWDPQQNTYVTVAGYGDSPEWEEEVRALPFPSHIFTETTAAEPDPSPTIEVSATDQPALQVLLQRVGIISALFFLLRRGPRTIGALYVGYRRPLTFAPRQKRLARGIAQLASFAIANAKLLEELENSNRIKEDFVGTMSHELRTPLHILYGYTELLQDEVFGPLTPQQAEILGRIDRNVRELTTLINTTLDLSRLQSQRVPLTVQEVQVPELLSELAGEIRQLNPTTDLNMEWSYSPDVPALWTDVGKLKIILKNLLTNALKFTERGTIAITVIPQGEGVTFTVSDTGAGIPADVLPFIFEPFRQGGTFTTRKQGGVGLGLYIVQQLLDFLGGKATVESEVGKGSTFSVWIPRQLRARNS
jgi:PAS domain S-box-containing protein